MCCFVCLSGCLSGCMLKNYVRPSPSTTRSRKPISSSKMIACRYAFASAVVGSPVFPKGTSGCILFTKGIDNIASACSTSSVGSQVSFQIFVDSPFPILHPVPSSSKLRAFQMLFQLPLILLAVKKFDETLECNFGFITDHQLLCHFSSLSSLIPRYEAASFLNPAGLQYPISTTIHQ
ncbi:uncharacterized protein [Gossypium hirsutum]|uniref:Uncharacterized protein isoform X2 n=1 Tax=Gossypium hirsutum TaxID=3635 RepID=A0ABM2Z441_GOSHI|nr:uncharacterized protein LOC107896629 isoform X2 [Gossypium hirsutum]